MIDKYMLENKNVFDTVQTNICLKTKMYLIQFNAHTHTLYIAFVLTKQKIAHAYFIFT